MVPGFAGAMLSAGARHATRRAVTANRRFYDALWSASYVVPPQRFNTWPLLSALSALAPARLEIGPGLHPRLPIAGTYFVDVSRQALSHLKAHGGLAALGEITTLPFADCTFDLVCAFDIVEHVEDDRHVFREIGRVARDEATVIFSVPLHPARWSAFDALVGHVRRYDPDDLLTTLAEHSFVLEQSAGFGMQPRSGWLLDFAVWGLTQRRVEAMRWYNRFLLPLGLLLQRRLAWGPGLIDVAKVDELLLVCRRGGRPSLQHTSERARCHRADRQATSYTLTDTRRALPQTRTTSPAHLAFLASTAALGGVAAHAAVRGVPGFAVIGAVSVAWGAIAVTGVFLPWLEMFGRVVSRGPAGSGRVALTFDDGPHPVTTRRVLEALAPTRHRATFFVLGEKARRHPDVLREIHAAGHTLGVHGDSHDRLHSFRMPWSVRDEIVRAEDAVEAATGVRPRFFRPPLGHTSVTTVRGARLAGVTLIGWSSRGYDGIRGRNPGAVVKRIGRTLTDGAIVMLHDAAEHDDFEPASVRALPRLVALLDERGLTSVGLDALLRGW